MGRLRVFWLVALAGMALLLPHSRAVSTNLVFDAITKEFKAKPGEMNAEFDFSVTNTGPVEVTINSVRASCGCTTPKMPMLPWKLEPGTNGSFHVTVDLRGKFGEFQKSIFMDTTEGAKMLYVKVVVPPSTNGTAMAGMDSRTRAMQIAQADRQAIFRGECAKCHTPAVSQKGEQLFTTACAICHESEERAVMVPDLHALKQEPNAAYWDAWVRNGKVGTMMPAFSDKSQGPLTDDQIESLVAYLTTEFPKRAPRGKTITTTASVTPRPMTIPQVTRRAIPVNTSPGPTLEAPAPAPTAPPPVPTFPTDPIPNTKN